MFKSVFYVGLLVLLLLLLGSSFPKLALSFAALILLGSAIYNKSLFQ